MGFFQALSVGEWAAAFSILGAIVVGIFRGGRHYARMTVELERLQRSLERNDLDHEHIKELLGAHDRLLARGVPPPEVREALDVIKQRLQRMERLLDEKC